MKTGRPFSGRKIVTTAATAVQLSTSSVPCLEVAIAAETDNTGVITVGDSSVVGALATRKGYPLNAGEKVVLPVSDMSSVYLDTTVNGDGVTFLAVIN